MAIKLISNKLSTVRSESSEVEYVSEYICDTDADFTSLPKCGTGSMAVSASTGNIQIVNASGKWVSFGG